MSNDIFGVQVTGERSNNIIPAGTYDAVLHAVIQNGIHSRQYQGKELPPANMIKLLFEIPSLTNGDGKTVIVGKEMPAKMDERANFFKYLKALGAVKEVSEKERRRLFGTKEAVESLLGSALSLTIEHFERQDGTKGHYIASVTRLDPRLPQPEAVQEPFIFSFSAPSLDVFKNRITKFGRKRIIDALNSSELPKEFHELAINEQTAEAEKPKSDDGNGVI